MSFKTLNIGATALLTQRYALDTVGQNIANASTPGYTRQRLQTEAVRPEVHPFGAVGSGVMIKQVVRVADEFLEKQVRTAKGTHDYLDHLQKGYENLEVFFNELTDQDLSSEMNNFWNAVSDLSNQVEDISTRRALIEKGRSLRDSFIGLEDKIREYRIRQNEEAVEAVNRINVLVQEVAALNTDIVKVESGGITGVVANDLRDQRTERLKELSGLMDITVTEESSGAVIVTQKSRLLVFEHQYFELATREITSDDLTINIPVFAADEEEVTLLDGKLASLVDLRDVVLKGFKDDIDQLAATFAWEFNRVHTQGIGLSGYSTITGTTSVVDPSQLLDELTFDFTPKAGTFQIVNGNFEIVVHDQVSDEDTVLNIEVDLDNRIPPEGDEDMILYDPLNPGATNSLVNRIQAAFDSIRPGLFNVQLDLGNHLVIDSLNSEFTFSFGRDTSGVLATLGLNTFFDGYDAGSFDVNSRIAASPELVTGATSFVPGDNTGAIAMLELRETNVLSSGTATIDDFYEGIVGRLGIEAQRTDSMLETQKDILVRMENQREDLSGVNLDEELTKMIQFQRSFQSAARFISTADVILETLINM